MNHPMKGSQCDKLLFRDVIGYECEFQREKVAAKTVLAIQQQLPDVECEGLVHRFQSSGRMAFGALSYINIQAYRSRIQLRSLHTFPDTCAIIKSYSSFRIETE